MRKICLWIIIGCFVFQPVTGWAAGKTVRGDITASLRSSYDDNITNTQKAFKKSDLIHQVSLGVMLGREGKTRSWKIDGQITQKLFARNASLNNFSQYLTGQISKEFSKYDRLYLRNAFERAENITRFEDAFGEKVEPFRFFRNRFSARYEKDLAKRLALKAHYKNEVYETRRETSPDSVWHDVDLQIDYIRASNMFFLLNYGVATRHYSTGEDSLIHDLLAGGRYYFTPVFYADIRAGVSFIETFDHQNLTEPKYVFLLTNDLSEVTQARFSYQKSSRAGSARREIFDSWRIAGSLRRQLLRRLGLSAEIFYGRGEYASLSVKDTLSGASIQMNYALKKEASLSLAYRYAQTNSSQDSRDYVRNTITLGLTFKF